MSLDEKFFTQRGNRRLTGILGVGLSTNCSSCLESAQGIWIIQIADELVFGLDLLTGKLANPARRNQHRRITVAVFGTPAGALLAFKPLPLAPRP